MSTSPVPIRRNIVGEAKNTYKSNGVVWDLPDLPRLKKDGKNDGYVPNKFRGWCNEFMRRNHRDIAVLQEHFEIIYKAFDILVGSHWNVGVQNLHRKAAQACREEASGETAQKILQYGIEYARQQLEQTAAEKKPKPDAPFLTEMSTDVSSAQPKWWMRKCAICSSTAHFIDTCTVLRAEYDIYPFNPRVIERLPVYCYNCGRPGHTCSSREKDSWAGRYSRELREKIGGLIIGEASAGYCPCDAVGSVRMRATKGQVSQSETRAMETESIGTSTKGHSQVASGSKTQDGASTRTVGQKTGQKSQKTDRAESQGDGSKKDHQKPPRSKRAQKRKAEAEPDNQRAQKLIKVPGRELRSSAAERASKQNNETQKNVKREM